MLGSMLYLLKLDVKQRSDRELDTVALLRNTNGMVFFADTSATNSQRFYCAVLP